MLVVASDQRRLATRRSPQEEVAASLRKMLWHQAQIRHCLETWVVMARSLGDWKLQEVL
jgi:hypothetical protein